ncbi:MAG: hypothetical protein IJ523_10675 [Succinivibrionaceae bacterium]|nr:hypothetical protein [Succinivibrionaceae bacterium]
MYVKLSDEQLFLIRYALLKACAYEVENLKYIDHCSDTRKHPSISAARSLVAEYLNMHLFLMQASAASGTKGERDEAERDAWTNIKMVAGEWNREIRRIKSHEKV